MLKCWNVECFPITLLGINFQNLNSVSWSVLTRWQGIKIDSLSGKFGASDKNFMTFSLNRKCKTTLVCEKQIKRKLQFKAPFKSLKKGGLYVATHLSTFA